MFLHTVKTRGDIYSAARFLIFLLQHSTFLNTAETRGVSYSAARFWTFSFLLRRCTFLNILLLQRCMFLNTSETRGDTYSAARFLKVFCHSTARFLTL